jgi:hypothetical protein
MCAVSATSRHGTRRLVGAARRVPAIVLCALAAHAVIYHSLWPADGVHGYFAWYAPLVAVLSGISIVVLPLTVAIAAGDTSENRLLGAIGSLVPRTSATGGAAPEIARLASGAIAFLFVQESLEHSLAAHHFGVAALTPFDWLVLVVAVVLISAGIAYAGRAVLALADELSHRGRPVSLRAPYVRAFPGTAGRVRRSRPLAVHGGLRAPPVAA